MSFINYSSAEIYCKVVYYGPGLCGKTTNLQHIYDHTAPEARGKMISLATETERTLFSTFFHWLSGQYGLQDAISALHDTWSGILRCESEADFKRCGRCCFCSGQSARASRCEP